jgi:hypothetical protein
MAMPSTAARESRLIHAAILAELTKKSCHRADDDVIMDYSLIIFL